MEFGHHTVMLAEAVDALAVKPGGRYCDVTVGGGGHTAEILKRSAPDGRVLAIDRDEDALNVCREKFRDAGGRIILRHGTFDRVGEFVDDLGWKGVDGVLADLGVSSYQFDCAERGFSFSADGPLDMRMNQRDPFSAYELISQTGEKELADIIYQYGEETKSRKVASAIKRAQKSGELTDSTASLRDIITSTLGPSSFRQRKKIHPATRTFQALRIAVNDELQMLSRFLTIVIDCVKQGGRVAVISFHSLEDRIVKRMFAQFTKERPNPADTDWEPPGEPIAPVAHLITKKPLYPSDDEIDRNPRARSARLRVMEKQ